MSDNEEQPPIGQPQRKTFNGQEYRLRPWEYEDAKLWGFRLFGMLAKSGGGFNAGSIGANAVGMSEETWKQFCSVVEKYTDVVGQNQQGQETIVPLVKVASVHMRGRLGTIVELIAVHVATEFRDFFEKAAGMIVAAISQRPKNEAA